jgi:hypothetical protein
MYNITVDNMDLQSTSADIKVSAYEANSIDLRIKNTNRGVCVASRWGTSTISNLLFEQRNIETHSFHLDW